MIEILFTFGSDIIEVVIKDTNLLFQTKQTGSVLAPIDALRLDKAGCILEHPDLKDREDWREETIKRLKIKVKNMENEEQRAEYVINELKSKGYIPYMKRKQGFRPIKF